MDEQEKQYEILVHGRVQGVGFRYAARNQARFFALKGWVENLPDGSVRIQIRGKQDACLNFLQWCRKGPAYGWVERATIIEKNLSPLPAFKIRY